MEPPLRAEHLMRYQAVRTLKDAELASRSSSGLTLYALGLKGLGLSVYRAKVSAARPLLGSDGPRSEEVPEEHRDDEFQQ